MSHTTKIRSVPIKDTNALREAVSRLQKRGVDCTLVENARPRMFYPQQEVQCDFVLKLNNSQYDVGFQKQADGSYQPIFDEWQDYVGKELAVKTCPRPGTAEEKSLRAIGMFSQEYNRCVTVNAMSTSGYMLSTDELDEKTGEYNLEFESY